MKEIKHNPNAISPFECNCLDCDIKQTKIKNNPLWSNYKDEGSAEGWDWPSDHELDRKERERGRRL